MERVPPGLDENSSRSFSLFVAARGFGNGFVLLGLFWGGTIPVLLLQAGSWCKYFSGMEPGCEGGRGDAELPGGAPGGDVGHFMSTVGSLGQRPLG